MALYNLDNNRFPADSAERSSGATITYTLADAEPGLVPNYISSIPADPGNASWGIRYGTGVPNGATGNTAYVMLIWQESTGGWCRWAGSPDSSHWRTQGYPSCQ